MTWGAPNPVWRGDTGLWEDSSRSIVHRQMALEKSSKDFSGSASLGQQDSSRDGRHPASAREKERTDVPRFSCSHLSATIPPSPKEE